MPTNTKSQATATAVLAAGDADGTKNRTIHGVAISDDEITNGLHGKKKWEPEDLEQAAPTLRGATVTAAPDVGGLEVEGALMDTNHGKRVRVGQITNSAYEEGVGVVYEMDVEDEDVYSALALGELDISIEASNPTDVDEDPETGATVMRGYDFTGMDVVEKGAARSNHTAAGPAANNAAIAALSAEDVSGMLDDSEQEAALAASVHTPSWSGKSTSAPSWADGSWERPSKSQFDTDDLSEIGDHFIASTSGFSSPETYSDLKLPVVEPNGDLNLNGLRAANTRVSQTDGLGDKQSAAETKIQNLASEEFDEDFGSDEEAANADADADADADAEAAASAGDEAEDEADQEASAGDTDDPSEGEVSADANDMATEPDSESDDPEEPADEAAQQGEGEDEDTGEVVDDAEVAADETAEEVDGPEDDDPETESTSGPDSDAESDAGNAAEDAETEVEPDNETESDNESGGASDRGADEDADTDDSPDDASDGDRDAETTADAESDSTMSNDNTPDEDESTDTQNAANEAGEAEAQSQSQSTDLNLDGQVVIDEERHDELKTKAALAEDLEEELEETKRNLSKREEQIETVHDVYSAALAEAGPHSEEFYQEMPLETLRNELRNTQGTEDDQAALEESVKNEQPLPQTGDQSADEGADEAALSAANETAEGALRLDDTAALAQSEQSAHEYVQDNFGVDATEYDDDLELRDAIYGEAATAGGGD